MNWSMNEHSAVKIAESRWCLFAMTSSVTEGFLCLPGLPMTYWCLLFQLQLMGEVTIMLLKNTSEKTERQKRLLLQVLFITAKYFLHKDHSSRQEVLCAVPESKKRNEKIDFLPYWAQELTIPHSFTLVVGAAFKHHLTGYFVFCFFCFFFNLGESKSMQQMHRRVINLNASWAVQAWLKEFPQ